MHAIVIEKDGFKVDSVALDVNKNPLFYELGEGESIIEQDWALANSMNKPKWDGKKWIETEPSPEPEPLEPGLSDIDLLMLAVAELDIQRSIDKTETQMAIAELASTMLGGM